MSSGRFSYELASISRIVGPSEGWMWDHIWGLYHLDAQETLQVEGPYRSCFLGVFKKQGPQYRPQSNRALVYKDTGKEDPPQFIETAKGSPCPSGSAGPGNSEGKRLGGRRGRPGVPGPPGRAWAPLHQGWRQKSYSY